MCSELLLLPCRSNLPQHQPSEPQLRNARPRTCHHLRLRRQHLHRVGCHAQLGNRDALGRLHSGAVGVVLDLLEAACWRGGETGGKSVPSRQTPPPTSRRW